MTVKIQVLSCYIGLQSTYVIGCRGQTLESKPKPGHVVVKRMLAWVNLHYSFELYSVTDLVGYLHHYNHSFYSGFS
jgi:hypothetical protein